MTFWLCSLVLAVAVTVAGVSAQDYHDSTGDDLSGDTDQGDAEVVHTRPGYAGNGRRGCSTFCPCAGSVRSSYCCPSSISMCGSVPAVQQPSAVGVTCRGSICQEEGRIVQPEIYSGRTVCRGTLCYRRGRRIVRPAEDICTSRMCQVLRPEYASQPLGQTCSSHLDCADNICCGHRCATVDACISAHSAGTYHSAQAPPSSLTGDTSRTAGTYHYAQDSPNSLTGMFGRSSGTYHYAQAPPSSLTGMFGRSAGTYHYAQAPPSALNGMFGRSAGTYHSAQGPPTSMTASARWCTADISCNRHDGGNHICCNGQCRTKSTCNPAGMYDLHDFY